MTLWLAAALVAAVVVIVGPRPASSRLATLASRARPSEGGTDHPAVGVVDGVVALVTGSGLVALRLPLVVAMAGGVLPLGIVRLRRARFEARQRTDRESAVAEITFALAGELRAGRTPSEALRAAGGCAGPLSGTLLAAAEAVALGGSAAAELDAAAGLPGAARLHAVAAAWRVTESAGGRIALVLERLGDAMDRDDELRRDMAALMAAPKATMTLLAGLPLFGLAIGQAIGAHPFHLLIYRPMGWALLAGAAVLDALGIVTSRQITKWALRC